MNYGTRRAAAGSGRGRGALHWGFATTRRAPTSNKQRLRPIRCPVSALEQLELAAEAQLASCNHTLRPPSSFLNYGQIQPAVTAHANHPPRHAALSNSNSTYGPDIDCVPEPRPRPRPYKSTPTSTTTIAPRPRPRLPQRAPRPRDHDGSTPTSTALLTSIPTAVRRTAPHLLPA
jgi:hypothetical protein